MPDYHFLKETVTGAHWQRLGVHRRAGAAVPLFSVYSDQSCGIGEIPDIRLLVDWCQKAGMSLLQLLPLNDVGFRYTPYDAESTFALEPAYLRLSDMTEPPSEELLKQVELIRKQFPANTEKVNYEVKKAKLTALRNFFNQLKRTDEAGFQQFLSQNKFWIRDYGLFKALKDTYGQKNWEDWPEDLKNRLPQSLETFEAQNQETVLFYQWLQYQLYRQFLKVREYAQSQGVFLMGDLPFLVSRDSADVWSNPGDFKLELSSGAPPDLYFAKGQRWGMPPYRWDKIAESGYAYVIEKLRYAEKFYDLYRIDHAVGIFRVWTIQQTEPLETHGYNGKFDPEDPGLWEEQGRRLLLLMIRNASMLPCAEDLGVVPDCAVKVLGEFGIPGMDVQRWRRDWGNGYGFVAPENYRPVSIALISTHDMDGFKNWWEGEVGTIDAVRFERSCGEHGVDKDFLRTQLFDSPETSSAGRLRWKSQLTQFENVLDAGHLSAEQGGFLREYFDASVHEREQFLDFLADAAFNKDSVKQSSAELVRASLERVNQSSSIFSIQLFSDLVSIAPELHAVAEKMKVNWPGTYGNHNWSARMPIALEKLVKHSLNKDLSRMHQASGRV